MDVAWPLKASWPQAQSHMDILSSNLAFLLFQICALSCIWIIWEGRERKDEMAEETPAICLELMSGVLLSF